MLHVVLVACSGPAVTEVLVEVVEDSDVTDVADEVEVAVDVEVEVLREDLLLRDVSDVEVDELEVEDDKVDELAVGLLSDPQTGQS